MLAVFALLVMHEPDLDSTIVLGADRRRRADRRRVSAPTHLAKLVGGAAVRRATVLALAAPYRRARMLAFLHPWHDTSNTGYQISQSLIALGSGGCTGVGLGAGRAKWLFLPNAHTDFIFAIIGEELGLVGCLLVLGLFVGFGLVGFRVARARPTASACCSPPASPRGSSARPRSTSARSSGAARCRASRCRSSPPAVRRS